MKETGYLFQAALIVGWWSGLLLSPEFFAAFQFAGIAAPAFWSFFLPDLLVIAGLSVIRGYRSEPVWEHLILGGFAYGALYCLNASWLTGSGYLPTGLMLFGLGYNGFLCSHQHFFRKSATTSLVRNAVKTLVQIVCIWFLTLVAIPAVILQASGNSASASSSFVVGLAVVLFVLCSGLGLTSAWFMVRYGQGTPLPLDQANRLVVQGPYRYVRNPMAVAGIGQGLALALGFQSWPLALYAVLGALTWQIVVRPIEERDLELRFGAPYLAYRQRVNCWLPCFRRRKLGDHER